MFGNNPRVTPLVSRKQLLIAESEINRVRMQEEWQAMADGVRSLADRAKSLGSIASAAAMLVTGVAAFRRDKHVDAAAAKPSCLQNILKGAGLISNLWLAFRARPR